MTNASLWLKTFAVGFIIVSAMLVLTLFTAIPYGDLSRIGRLSDDAFGWRAPPPPAPPEQYMKSVPVSEADIVVVGDSFSMSFYWQAELTKAGYRVATVYWGQFGYLCKDFGPGLRQAGFKGDLVIVQSVERLLGERLEKSDTCTQMLKAPDSRPTPFMKYLTEVPNFGLNWSAKLNTGLITWRNMRQVERSNGDTLIGDEVLVRPVPEGCKQFSHPMCNRALFFKEDLDNGPLTAEHFAQLQRITAAQKPLRLLWMVIPNKTTVYLQPESSAPFMAPFRQAGLGPDLFDFAQRERHTVRDFYFPNDTHMSMHGQIALGQLMLKNVSQIEAPPARKTP